MDFIKNKGKGQGALEYLLIIGAALIVAVTVIVLVISMSGSSTEQAGQQGETLSTLIDNALNPPVVTYINGCGDGAKIHLIETETNGTYKIYKDGTAVGGIYTASNGIITLDLESAESTDRITVSLVKNNRESRPSTPSSRCTP